MMKQDFLTNFFVFEGGQPILPLCAILHYNTV